MPILFKALPAIHFFLAFALAIWSVTFLVRIVMTWYPEVNLQKGFWPLVALPTELLLAFTRRFVPPIGGVDVTPVIWFGLISLSRELLVGQQGLITQLLTLTK